MKKIFQIWLSIFFILAFLLTTSFSYWQLVKEARLRADRELAAQLTTFSARLDQRQKETERLRHLSELSLQLKARLTARLIAQSPLIAADRAKLDELRRFLDVDELHVTDTKGVIVCAVPPLSEGYDLASDAQTIPLLKALKDKSFCFVQSPCSRVLDGLFFQYAAVARQDRSGCLLVGLRPRILNSDPALSDWQWAAAGTRIGKAGGLLVLRQDKVIYATGADLIGVPFEKLGIARNILVAETGLAEFIRNQKVRCCGMDRGDCRLVAFLPESEVEELPRHAAKLMAVEYFLILLLLYGGISLLLKYLVTNRIARINASLEEITHGDLNEIIEICSPQEFRQLADGINATVTSLKKQTETVQRHYAEDMNLARRVQLASLPVSFPVIPLRHRFAIDGRVDSSRNPGGDFYDFFPVGKSRAAVVIGDVFGKGIAATLCMMEIKTLLHHFLEEEPTPAAALAAANRLFCANNRSDMFVSVWAAVFDPADGRLTAANAGHLPPYWLHEGKWSLFQVTPSLVLGGMADTVYQDQEITLAPGDRLLLFSDGVTECVDPKQELLGIAGLAELLQKEDRVAVTTPEEWLKRLHQRICDYSSGSEILDDQTMVGLICHGRMTEPAVLDLDASRAGWLTVRSFLEERLTAAGTGSLLRNRLLVAAEELFARIALHEGSAEHPCRLRISYFFEEESRRAELTFRYPDRGWDPVEEIQKLTLQQQERQDLMGMRIVLKTAAAIRCEANPDGTRTITLSQTLI